MLRRSVLLMVLVLALVGCGAADTGQGTTVAVPTPTDDAGQSGADASPTAQPDSGAPLVVLAFEGGLKPVKSTLTIEADGTARLVEEGFNKGSSDQSWTVPQEQLEELKRLINSPEFAALEESYLPKNTCCDRVIYTLTAGADAGEKTITTIDGVDQPATLNQVLDLLARIRAGAPAQ